MSQEEEYTNGWRFLDITENTPTIHGLLTIREQLYKKINELNEQITTSEQEISDLYPIMLKICKHNWEYTREDGPYGQCYYECNICQCTKSR